MLVGVSRLSWLALLALLVLSPEPVNPLRLIRLVTGVCLVPFLAAWALRRLYRGHVRVSGGSVIVEDRAGRVEIPVASIVAIEGWTIPLPAPGVSLRLRSGERWGRALAMDDPILLVEALVEGGGVVGLGEAATRPSLVYARARSRTVSARLWDAFLKFPVFALVPTIPLFRVHQIISYGGALGEYYQYGLGPYLAGFAVYWATLTIYLTMYAAALRVPLEVVARMTASIAPDHALGVRRAAERIAALLYYGGVPIAVGLRFLPW